MAAIEKRVSKDGKISYRAKIRLKGHPPQSATFNRITDAKMWIQQTEAAIREGRHFKAVESKKRSLAELISRFIESESCSQRVDSMKVETHLDWWKARLGHYMLSDITPIRIGELKDSLRNEKTKRGDQRSNGTINRYFGSLSICFSYAVKELGWVDENPVLKVKKAKEPKGRVRFLTDDERKRLLNAAKEDIAKKIIYPIIVLALSTGMRSTEITTLKWSHIDLKRKRVMLDKTKNGERRTIPLSKQAFEIISEMSRVRKIGKDYLFTHKDDITPYNPRKAWLRVTEKAKLNNFRFHDLRHTAASYLAMNGASLLEIADILGHKTLAMVKRYSHLTESHTAGVLERMNDAQFGEIEHG